MRYPNFYLQSFKIYNLHDYLNTQNYYFEQTQTTSSFFFFLCLDTPCWPMWLSMCYKELDLFVLLLSNLHCKYNLVLVVPTATSNYSIQLTSISCSWLFRLLSTVGYCSQYIDRLMLTYIYNWRDAVCNRLCFLSLGSALLGN